MVSLFLVVLSYLIGSIPFSYLAGRWLGGIDIRSHGSGNVGTTNVLRTLGWQIALFAFVGDFLKGVVAVWLASLYGNASLILFCALAVALGHCYPIFLSFKGGKAVATSAGVLLYAMPKVFLVLLLVFAAIVLLSRYVSLASIGCAIVAPFLAIFFYGDTAALVIMAILMAVLTIYRHRPNIERLRNGTEPKFGGLR